MKFRFAFTAFIFLLPGLVSSQVPTFRNTTWGMTRNQIRQAEDAKLISHAESENELVYETELAGLNCILTYYFVDNQLSGASYKLRDEAKNPFLFFTLASIDKSLFWKTYREIRSVLLRKYGKPIGERNHGHLRRKKNTVQYLRDIRDERHATEVQWGSEATEIYLWLYGEHYELTTTIEYISKEHKHRFEELERKIDFSKL